MRWLAALLGVVVAVLLGLELAAAPLATRAVADALGDEVEHDEVQVRSLGRPAAPGLLVGRARDVEVVLTGVRFEELRVDRALAEIAELRLPWSPGGPRPAPATLTVEVTEADLAVALAARSPFGLQPAVELDPGGASIGIDPLPLRLRVMFEVDGGVLRVAPAGPVPEVLAGLGLEVAFELPDGFRLERIELEAGRLRAVLDGVVDVAAFSSALEPS